MKELVKEMPGADRSRVVDPNDEWTRRAKNSAFDWIVKIVQRNWLPTDPSVLGERMVMIRNAFGPNDVTYSQWEAHGHIVRVAQMATIVLIRVRPISPDQKPKLTQKAQTALARDVVTGLIRDEVDLIVTGPTDRKKVKKIILPDVLAASFEHGNVRQCTDGVHGKCARPELLEKRVHHYLWWWRCINWWTDGSEVGVYMLKTEGGPWVPSYTSGLDATWFEGDAPRKRRN